MRKAASGWEDDYAKRLVNDGPQGSFKDILPSPELCVVVHADDFTFAATESELRKMQSRM